MNRQSLSRSPRAGSDHVRPEFSLFVRSRLQPAELAESWAEECRSCYWAHSGRPLGSLATLPELTLPGFGEIQLARARNDTARVAEKVATRSVGARGAGEKRIFRD